MPTDRLVERLSRELDVSPARIVVALANLERRGLIAQTALTKVRSAP